MYVDGVVFNSSRHVCRLHLEKRKQRSIRELMFVMDPLMHHAGFYIRKVVFEWHFPGRWA